MRGFLGLISSPYNGYALAHEMPCLLMLIKPPAPSSGESRWFSCSRTSACEAAGDPASHTPEASLRGSTFLPRAPRSGTLSPDANRGVAQKTSLSCTKRQCRRPQSAFSSVARSAGRRRTSIYLVKHRGTYHAGYAATADTSRIHGNTWSEGGPGLNRRQEKLLQQKRLGLPARLRPC
jgi:hypothetical protein